MIKIVIAGNMTEFEAANIPKSSFMFSFQFQVIYHNKEEKDICWIEEQDGRTH